MSSETSSSIMLLSLEMLDVYRSQRSQFYWGIRFLKQWNIFYSMCWQLSSFIYSQTITTSNVMQTGVNVRSGAFVTSWNEPWDLLAIRGRSRKDLKSHENTSRFCSFLHTCSLTRETTDGFKLSRVISLHMSQNQATEAGTDSFPAQQNCSS